jgi:hypothetical protein
MENKEESLSFNGQELTYLLIALKNYNKKLATSFYDAEKETEVALEDILMVDWLIKKIEEAQDKLGN